MHWPVLSAYAQRPQNMQPTAPEIHLSLTCGAVLCCWGESCNRVGGCRKRAPREGSKEDNCGNHIYAATNSGPDWGGGDKDPGGGELTPAARLLAGV